MTKIPKTKLHLKVEVPCIEKNEDTTSAMYFAKVYVSEFPNKRYMMMLSDTLAESSKKCNEVHPTLKFTTDTRGRYFGWKETVKVRCHDSDKYSEEVGKKALLAKIEVKANSVYRRLMQELDDITCKLHKDNILYKLSKVNREIAKQKEYIKKNF